MLEVLVAGLLGQGHRRGGQVEDAALAAQVAGDGDQQPTRPQDLEAAGVHGGHLGQVGGAAGVAEVGRVGGVVLGVAAAQAAAVAPGGLVDHPGGAGVRRGGRDQVDRATKIAEQLRQAAGVADADLAEPGALRRQRQGEVVAGQVRPAGLQLHAEAAASQGGGLDQGGADAAHGVDDQPAGWRVLGGDAPGQLGQHLGGVGGGGRQVAAGALDVAGGLRARPDRQRDRLRLGRGRQRERGRGSWGHGLAR